MLVVPTLLFVIPALVGHPAIDGDNLIQNFPLRVLSGQQIASGHLPLFNPLANSGTPLLGGLNAGSLYPLTVIFAFVPPIAAWLINCIAVYLIAATGMFALLRWHGMRTLSSFAAAMTYAYSGAMVGQLVHLGVVQGFAFIPWATLILVSLSRRLSLEPTTTTWRHYARVSKPWIWGYALLWGLTFLTGEPRGIAEIELLTLIVGPSVLLIRSSYWIQTWRGRVAYVVALAAGLAWGSAIGLVQLLPGWSFIGLSQRSSISYGYFGAGSLVVRWTSLLFMPDIFGGNGSGGQPNYFAHYNLPEVTGYVGVLALVATFAFLTKLTRRGWKGEDRDYVALLRDPGGRTLRDVGLVHAARSRLSPHPALRQHATPESQRHPGRLRDDRVARMVAPSTRDAPYGRGGTRGPNQVADARAGLRRDCAERRTVRVGSAHRLVPGGLPPTRGPRPRHAPLLRSAPRDRGRRSSWRYCRWRHSKNLMKVLMGVLVADVLVFLIFSATALFGGSGPTEPSAANAMALLGTNGRTALVDQGGAQQSSSKHSVCRT